MLTLLSAHPLPLGAESDESARAKFAHRSGTPTRGLNPVRGHRARPDARPKKPPRI